MRPPPPVVRRLVPVFGLVAAFVLAAAAPAFASDTATDRLRHWNSVAIDASGLDHKQPGPGDTYVFGQQLGPGRSARAMAIVHIAMFDAVNAIDFKYESYTGLRVRLPSASPKAALAQAAHDTLVAMYPSQAPTFDAELAAELAQIRNGVPKFAGMILGHIAARRILDLRDDDGSQHAEPIVDSPDWPTSDEPGHWRQDPVSLIPLALGAFWGGVDPFVLESADQFPAPEPPALTSAEYTEAFNEVKRLGAVNSTERTDEQTFIGIFWAYDGTPSLCAPPRLYNQIALAVADERGTEDVVQIARLLALINTSMADAGIAAWESKYFYDFWRPVTGIREADPGTGTTGLGDGNPDTMGDVNFTPLGAPASNTGGAPDFTPPFPAYPSGHATFGGAIFQTLRRFYRTDDIPFEFVSDEFNGVTKDRNGDIRPLMPRSFDSLSEAEEENGQSRIYLGIHWAFDKTEGIAQGRRVADYVFDHSFRRRR